MQLIGFITIPEHSISIKGLQETRHKSLVHIIEGLLLLTMSKTKEISLELRKKIVEDHKGEGYTDISKHSV